MLCVLDQHEVVHGTTHERPIRIVQRAVPFDGGHELFGKIYCGAWIELASHPLPERLELLCVGTEFLQALSELFGRGRSSQRAKSVEQSAVERFGFDVVSYVRPDLHKRNHEPLVLRGNPFEVRQLLESPLALLPVLSRARRAVSSFFAQTGTIRWTPGSSDSESREKTLSTAATFSVSASTRYS